jgi:TPR repeat protein/serine/threonine protein kinase
VFQGGMEKIGPYEIIGEIGRGGMGVVYRAFDPVIGRPVAIKMVRLDESMEPPEREFLRGAIFREARSAGILSHSSIVKIYQISEDAGNAFIAMEFVNGPTLEQLLSRSEPLDKTTIWNVLRQSAGALDYAHQKGIVHRDVKPANIMIDEDGAVKICDFGVAKMLGITRSVTRTGQVVGTPFYMSPEQLRGKTLDGRTDQYSLAVVAYQMLTGQRPLMAETMESLLFKVAFEEPSSVRDHNPSLGKPVEAVFRTALSKQPEARYANCGKFVEALWAACEASVGWEPVAQGGKQSEIADSPSAIKGPEPVQQWSSLAPTEFMVRESQVESLVNKPKPVLPILPTGIALFVAVALIAWAVVGLKHGATTRSTDTPQSAARGPAPATLPIIVYSFSSDPPSIKRGGSAKLHWSVSNATEVRVEPGVGTVAASGYHDVSPSETTSYELVAKGAGGEVRQHLNVNVTVSATATAITSFSIDRPSIKRGESAKLNWSVSNATEVRIEPGVGAVAGSGYRDVSPPETTNYELIVKGPGGDSRRAVRVEVTAALLHQAAKQSPIIDPLFDTGAIQRAWASKDYVRIRALAETGSAEAQNYVGVMYRTGQGIPKDDAQALAWYRKAADQGLALAQSNIGAIYALGRGVPKDDNQAVIWYRRAADQGLAMAQNILGSIYADGRGVPKDDNQAVIWYRKAADQGDASGQNNLGFMYQNGRGITKDEEQAVAWYRKAADQGLAAGQDNLGFMYQNGRGVAKNDDQALAWYRKAADQGNAVAQGHVGFMYENNLGACPSNQKSRCSATTSCVRNVLASLHAASKAISRTGS